LSRRTRAFGFGLVVALAGCGQAETGPADPPAGTATPAAAAPDSGTTAAATTAAGAPDARYSRSFAEAAITDAVPDGQHPPPPKTLAGVSTALIRTQVEQLWPSIALTGPDGKPLAITARLETDFGPVEIALRPDLAPNHVRNFVALARAKFYDGLVFERVIRQEVVDENDVRHRLELLTAGCPTGTGEYGFGHLAYFLKPEFSDELHEAGTVGFWHEEAPESAGCRFYVTLGPAPTMDKNYTVIGKVTRGLDVLRKIVEQPVVDKDVFPDCERPRSPTAIRRVAVEGVDAKPPVAQN
jgi:cyclophilin family peptidyl-prolyl cis-trans isomerase